MFKKSSSSKYTEEQSTAWLAWLAYNLQKREQTIFQIEEIQPEWLANEIETRFNFVFSRVAWALLSGLVFSVSLGLMLGLGASSSSVITLGINFGFRAGLTLGLIFGLANGLCEAILPLERLDCFIRTHSYSMQSTCFWILLYALLLGLSVSIGVGMRVGIAYGLIGILLSGLIYALGEIGMRLNQFKQHLKGIRYPIRNLLIGTIKFGLIFSMCNCILYIILSSLGTITIPEFSTTLMVIFSNWMFSNHRGVIFYGTSAGLVFGLSQALIRVTRVTFRPANRQIQTVESLRWSWVNVRNNFTKGITFGLSVVFSVILLLTHYDQGVTIYIYGLLFGAIALVLFGLIGGLQPVAMELKSTPNQGIKLTVLSAIKIGLPVGIAVALILWLLAESITTGVLTGVAVSLVIALWYGGLDVLEHGIVRLIIAWRGHAPLNYAKFLDYAADELNFLQKVGGGYVFIHRYLLEHFAEIAVEKGYVEEATTNSDGN